MNEVAFRLCDPERSTKWVWNGDALQVAGTDQCLTNAPIGGHAPSGSLTTQTCAAGNAKQQWLSYHGQYKNGGECLSSAGGMASCDVGDTHSLSGRLPSEIQCTKPAGQRYYSCGYGTSDAGAGFDDGQMSSTIGSGWGYCRKGDWGASWMSEPCVKCSTGADCQKYNAGYQCAQPLPQAPLPSTCR
eukprot:SRR837773.22425.p2 GENE.SRR837773.22425~~SRR837773.22425.p2  ORF type:complete len:216 (-),score=29.66 SRR837773.22425:44-604(-)